MNRLTRLLGLACALAFVGAPALAAKPTPDTVATPPPQTIMLKVAVGADGKVQSATPVDPDAAPALNQAAQGMAQKLVFSPARKNGVAVPSQTHLSLLLALEPAGVGQFALKLRRAHNGPGVVRVGKMEPPKYGRALAVVTVDIGADGVPDMGTLASERMELKTPSKFAEARYLDAIAVSLRGSRFEPDLVDGSPVASRVRLPYQFAAGGNGRRGDKEDKDDKNAKEDEKPSAGAEDTPVMHAVSTEPGIELPSIDIKAAPAATPAKS
jgi:hypothetical protein